MGDFDWFSPCTPTLSESSPTSSSSSSPFLPATPILFSSSQLLFPLSPPAPHRKAPAPPTYRPRRPRARHINMREPARSGLFTVCETPEEEEFERMPRCTSPPELELDLSNYATSASESGCTTPGYESEDPFTFEEVLLRTERVASMFGHEEQEEMGIGLGLGIEMSRTIFSRPVASGPGSGKSPRRPPPLNLVINHHPYQLAPPPIPSPTRCAAPKLRPSALLPALPIMQVAPPAYQRQPTSPVTPTRPRRKTNHIRDEDLLLQFAELLESCGEDTASETFGFPLPPTRSEWSEEPKTPQRSHMPRRSPPPPPIRPRRPPSDDKIALWQRDQLTPGSPTSSHSASSSSASRRSLPRRAPIPWECKM